MTEEEKRQIYVFDEEYVDRNVKLHEDHLDTIVMLGEQADLTEQIKAAEGERDTAKTDYEKQKELYQEYCDPSNSKAPRYYLDKIKTALQGDSNWAGRDKRIRGNKQNSSVKDDTYKQFENITPSKSRDELIVDFNEIEKELIAAQAGESFISHAIPPLPDIYNSYDDAEIQKLLSTAIERPELSEREEYLLSLVQQGKSDDLRQRKTLFSNPKTELCPFCFQKLTQANKEDLILSIEKVLSRAVDEHQQTLRQYICTDALIDLSPFKKLNAYSACVILLEHIREAVQANNVLLQQKINDPYHPIESEPSCIQDLIRSLKQKLSTLEEQLSEHNKQAKSTEPIIERLHSVNREITHYDIVELANKHNDQLKEYQAAKKRLTELELIYFEKENNIRGLDARRQNITLALDTINNSMKYIFFAEDRLKIECVDGTYKLLSHGHSVRPCDISVGERNIIGLCYFFASILQGKKEDDAYQNEYLLVLDDPISSYDMENKIGILSFLKYKLAMFLEANINTKALVMTHDLMTFYDLSKIFEIIIGGCKSKGYPTPPKFIGVELRDSSLHPFQYGKRQEYTELINIIYSYALGNATGQELVIGNMMRQVLEAFSTFEYKKGINKISSDEQILSGISNEAYKAYFKNLMYRLVLHGGSHREEQVKSMNDLNFFELISEEEKKRTAKDVLCFIYLLNKPHLISHLKEFDNSAEETLNSWCSDIQARSIAL